MKNLKLTLIYSQVTLLLFQIIMIKYYIMPLRKQITFVNELQKIVEQFDATTQIEIQ